MGDALTVSAKCPRRTLPTGLPHPRTWINQRGVYIKNGAYYLVRKNKWHFLGRNPSSAHAKLQEFNAAEGIPSVSRAFLQHALDSARHRARRGGQEFSIGMEDLERLWVENKGRCALSGVAMNEANPSQLKRRPFIPSIDQIKPRGGYTAGNVRLVCFAMNAALNAWGEEVFHKIASGFMKGRAISPALDAAP